MKCKIKIILFAVCAANAILCVSAANVRRMAPPADIGQPDAIKPETPVVVTNQTLAVNVENDPPVSFSLGIDNTSQEIIDGTYLLYAYGDRPASAYCTKRTCTGGVFLATLDASHRIQGWHDDSSASDYLSLSFSGNHGAGLMIACPFTTQRLILEHNYLRNQNNQPLSPAIHGSNLFYLNYFYFDDPTELGSGYPYTKT